MPIRSAKQDLSKWRPAVHAIVDTRPAVGKSRGILNIDNPDVAFVDRSEVAHCANPLVEVPNELAVTTYMSKPPIDCPSPVFWFNWLARTY